MAGGVSLDGISMLNPELQRAFTTAVKADRKPIETLQNQKTKIDARMELINEISGKIDGVKNVLPGLNSPIAIRELALATTDDKSISGTTDKDRAVPGSYSIEVAQLATQATAMSNTFEDKDKTRIGSGYFAISLPNGDSKEVFIDDDNSTLEGVANTINKTRGLGVRASVVNDQTNADQPWRLLLTVEGTGVNSNVDFANFYFLDGQSDFYIDKERPAQNGVIRYEGNEISIPGNELKDLIPGTTLTLKGVSDPGKPTQVTITQDLPKTTGKVKDFVDKMNGVLTFLQTQSKMDDKTDTSKTLQGDYSIRNAEQRLRSALSTNHLGDENRKIKTLNDIGIQFQKNGLLAFDEKKFQTALNGNYDEVVDLLVGDGLTGGVMPILSRTLNTLSGQPTAIFNNQKSAEMTKVGRINQDIARREKQSEKKQEELKAKLGKVQSAIDSMAQQSARAAASAPAQ